MAGRRYPWARIWRRVDELISSIDPQCAEPFKANPCGLRNFTDSKPRRLQLRAIEANHTCFRWRGRTLLTENGTARLPAIAFGLLTLSDTKSEARQRSQFDQATRLVCGFRKRREPSIFRWLGCTLLTEILACSLGHCRVRPLRVINGRDSARPMQRGRCTIGIIILTMMRTARRTISARTGQRTTTQGV